MVEPSIGHEHRRVGSISQEADVEQLDSGSVSCQALERQLDLREALELDPKSQVLLDPRRPLHFTGDVGLLPNRFKLFLQCAAMADAISLWDRSRTPGRPR